MSGVASPAARLSPSPVVLLALGLLLAVMAGPAGAAIHRAGAIAMHGEPKYPPDFKHFDYVNPHAPKGGTLKLHAMGSFDSFMPWLAKGTPAAGMAALGNSDVFDSLTVQSLDEPFTEYGLLAKTIEWPDDRRWVAFTLRKDARFADGTPVLAKDVVWTFHELVTQGAPMYAYYYADVARVEAVSKRKVKFIFKPGDNRELAMIVGQMPVLPEHYFKHHKFSRATLTPPMGSGPYKIVSFKPGKRVVYQRRKDYWGKNLPVMAGHNNFNRIVYEYYMDDTVALQAFLRGDYDWRSESSSKDWATAYDGKPFQDGTLVKENVKDGNPAGMQAFIFNTRRPVFQDRTLREAMGYAFDFQWSNKHLFYGQYKRTRSFFENSDLEATGLPSPAELKLLDPIRKYLPKRVFTQAYQPPVSSASGRPRKNLLKAQTMLQKAGYTVKGDQLYTPDGRPVKFEFLLNSPLFERVVLPFARNLAVLGIKARVVRVDQSQYVQRVREFDYDMIVGGWGESPSPGNEQRGYWTSAAAKRESSQNYAGIHNPGIDKLVNDVITAGSRQQLVTACHALDRALQWGFYVIPNWYLDHYRFAYQSWLAHPPLPRYTPPDGALDLWWDRNAH